MYLKLIVFPLLAWLCKCVCVCSMHKRNKDSQQTVAGFYGIRMLLNHFKVSAVKTIFQLTIPKWELIHYMAVFALATMPARIDCVPLLLPSKLWYADCFGIPSALLQDSPFKYYIKQRRGYKPLSSTEMDLIYTIWMEIVQSLFALQYSGSFAMYIYQMYFHSQHTISEKRMFFQNFGSPNYVHMESFQFDLLLKFIADKLNYILKIAKDHVAFEWNGMTHSVRRQCYAEYLALLCACVCMINRNILRFYILTHIQS